MIYEIYYTVFLMEASVSFNRQPYRILNWIFLVIQLAFLIMLITITVKYVRQYQSFRDKYTLWTLLTLIISLSSDCISIFDAYPWSSIDMNDLVSFISLQMSKTFFLISVMLYASRWVIMLIQAKYSEILNLKSTLDQSLSEDIQSFQCTEKGKKVIQSTKWSIIVYLNLLILL